jgi:predicted nucleic acid-binding protein
VLDTSVIIKWFRQGEVLAEPALALRDAYLEGHFALLAPVLCIYELANVLRYKNDLNTRQVQDAVQSLFDFSIEFASPSSEVIRRGVEIARIYETTVYDAAFVALAEIFDIMYVTADERLARRLTALSFVRYLGELQIDSLITIEDNPGD